MWMTEGLQHVLELMTQQQSVPTDYYMGLATDTYLSPASTMADVTELSGNGYGRLRVAPGNAKAEGTLTLSGLPADDDTMTIDSVTYRFKDVMGQAEDIQIEATVEDMQATIEACINGTGTEGVEYYASTTAPHTTVSIGAFASDEAVLQARTAGTAGNSIATTETFSSGAGAFDAATLGTTRAGGYELTSAAGGVNGRSLSTVTNTFTADGGTWNTAYLVFLTTTVSGTGGKLIVTEDINEGSGVTLTDGQSYDASMVLLAEPST